MEALPLAVTTGWASGVNAYACVLILGLLGRFAGADDVPHSLTTTPVLIIAGALFAVESRTSTRRGTRSRPSSGR